MACSRRKTERRRRIPLATMLAIGLVATFGGPETRAFGQGTPDTEFCRRLEAGDIDAVKRAGEMRQLGSPPCLRSLLAKHPDDVTRSAAELALAQLGDVRQLQKFLCQSRGPRAVEFTTANLEPVGGWFAIRGIVSLFAPELNVGVEKREKERQKRAPDLLQLYPSSYYVILGLNRVVPGVPEIPEDRDVSCCQWQGASLTRHFSRIAHGWFVNGRHGSLPTNAN